MSAGLLHSILYVEDDPKLRCVAKMALEVIGRFTVLDCGVGQAAVRAAAGFAPDLILLDVSASRCDAMQTLAMLRALPHLAHTPALLVTEMADGDAVLYLDADSVGVLPKPLEPMRLAARLREMWTLSQRAIAPALGIVPAGVGASIHARPGLL